MSAKSRQELLISASDLSLALESENPPVVLDVRFVPLQPGQIEEYNNGHIPGAIFVDLPQELAGNSGPGAYPLPEVADLQDSVRNWGVESETPVVVYDNFLGGGSARAWWTLTWAGLENVRILDGGLAAWKEIGGEISTSSAIKHEKSTVVLKPGALRELSIEEVDSFSKKGILVDSRPEGAFLKSDDVHSGHIPGAQNVPFDELFTENGLYKSKEELDLVFEAVTQRANIDSNIDVSFASYCGGGILATQLAFAQKLTEKSEDAPVFIGSWSAWIENPDRETE